MFFFSRAREELIFKSCALAKLSPGFIASFPGGRIEEYLNGSITLTTGDCKLYINEIAIKTADIHHHLIAELPKEPSIFISLTNWLKAASEVLPTTEKPAIKEFSKTINFHSLQSEIQFLKKIILPLNSPVVFCHNDLLSGNFMYNNQSKKLYVIDFEYANYNYRGYDLGNHFAEWAVDYSRPDYPKFNLLPQNYPTASERDLFIKTYLRRSKELNGQILNIEDSEIAQIQKEIDYFLLIPHFAWSLWAMIQAASSQIDFGYVEFAQYRLKHYFDLKKRFTHKTQTVIKNTKKYFYKTP